MKCATNGQPPSSTNFSRPALHEEQRTFSLVQRFGYEGAAGRLSSSYVPLEGDPNHEAMMRELQRIFDVHAVEGKIEFEYDTRVFYGHL